MEAKPGNIAVVIEDKHLSYKELNKRANQLAGVLQAKGIKADSIAAVMVERSLEMVVGILSILKAGGAYLPIDPQSPGTRVGFMLNDSGNHLLLTRGHLVDKNNYILGILSSDNIIALDDEAIYVGSASNQEMQVKPGDLAYSIYTSGTTGKPRGVMVTYRNVVNLVWGLEEKIYRHYNYNDNDNHNQQLRVCLLAPYVFDASVKQIFASLLLGHNFYVVPQEIRVDGWGLLQYYRKHQIDISDGTPAHIQLLAESLISHPLDVAVKHFIIGGEALAQATVVRFFGHFREERKSIRRLTNVYGPTECCVDSTYYEVTRANAALYENIPIGQSMPNYRVYIVDSWTRLQPVGISGELCVSGIGVARGYLNSPELTAEKFKRAVISHLSSVISSSLKTDDRFSKSTNDQCLMTNDRFYKTGDLARWQPNGNIEFLGRIDHQVKIRGFRIELGEIESQLLRYHKVKEAVVLARSDEAGDKYLSAYIVPNILDAFEELSSVSSVLREYLLQLLQDYMIPSYFVEIEKIPLTPNGKVDRGALPAPGAKAGEGYIAPGDRVEKKLAELWSEVLGVEKDVIGIESNFFQLGGHSLKATILVSKMHKEFDVRVPLVEIFKAPRINALA